MFIVIHLFWLAQEMTPKDLKLFQKVKMHVFVLLMQFFNPGGMMVDLQLARQQRLMSPGTCIASKRQRRLTVRRAAVWRRLIFAATGPRLPRLICRIRRIQTVSGPILRPLYWETMVALYLLRLIFRMRRIHTVSGAMVLRPVSRGTLVAQLSAICITLQFVAVNISRLTIPSMHVRILVLICVVSGLVWSLCTCVVSCSSWCCR